MAVYHWSKTASSNDTADPAMNWRELMAPSLVNDNVRTMMAELAKWRDDLAGNLVTGGSATAYTLTTNQGLTTLPDGHVVVARMHAANGAAPTLNVDSRGARAIASVYGTPIASGVLRAGAIYTFIYNAADNKWIVHGSVGDSFPSGTRLLFQQTTPPAGWTKDTSHNNKALRIVSGTVGSGGTSNFTDVFAARTISVANLPAHNHSAGTLATSSSGAHTHTFNYVRGSVSRPDSTSGTRFNYVVDGTTTTSSSGAHTHTITGNTGSTGSGTPMDFAVAYVDVIIAQRD